jgi:hypothetical protein
MDTRKFLTPGIGPTSCGVVWNSSRRGQREAVPCLTCGTSFQRGPAAWTFAVGCEILGYLGPCCLTPAARAELEQAGSR